MAEDKHVLPAGSSHRRPDAGTNVLTGALLGTLVTLMIGVLAFYSWKAWIDPTEGMSQASRDVAALSADISSSAANELVLNDGASDGTYEDTARGMTLEIPDGWILSSKPENKAFFVPKDKLEGFEQPDFISISFERAGFELTPTLEEEQAAGTATPELVGYAEQDPAVLGGRTFRVFTKGNALFGGNQYYYVALHGDDVIIFETYEGVRTALLSMLKTVSFDDDDGLNASNGPVAGLGNSDALFWRANRDDGHSVVGAKADGSAETTHLTLDKSVGELVGMDTDADRTKLAYVTQFRGYVRDLSTGVEELAFDGLSDGPTAEYSLRGAWLSPDGRHLASIVEYEDRNAISFFDLETRSFVPDDLVVSPLDIAWLTDTKLAFVAEDAAGTYDVVLNETVRFQEALFANEDRAFHARAFAVNAGQTRMAVLGSVVTDDPTREEGSRTGSLRVIDMKSGDQLQAVDLNVSVESAKDTFDRFGVAWQDEEERLVVSFDDEVWDASLEDPNGFAVPASIVADGRVVGILQNGEVALEQGLYDAAGVSAGERVRFTDAFVDLIRYSSAAAERVAFLPGTLR